ncbi:cation efflux system protein czcD [Coccidioides immitis RMSCC 3703]|uniref:Zinc transporter n=1 Tax=Coccidioides immitis RMSCC 3703 TaxID=454286 RepID=A0A0J8U3G9_COCIT|nr:cation efflux system protein czcD [Coccidioides immitis RMSCC 3703]
MERWTPLLAFANGVSLLIISIEIIFEAFERLISGSELNRLGELFIVSTLGLIVNMVGILAFDHAHHHGHGHSHSHGDHHHENMHGIYLHILADALGSVAVVGSTVLVHFFGWAGFDPIASCIIAVLIFVSAIPLVKTTAKTLLLAVPADVEYNLRDTLAGISTLRGVAGYTVPKFWLDDTHHDKKHGHVPRATPVTATIILIPTAKRKCKISWGLSMSSLPEVRTWQTFSAGLSITSANVIWIFWCKWNGKAKVGAGAEGATNSSRRFIGS